MDSILNLPVLLVTKKRPDVLNICFSGVDNDV